MPLRLPADVPPADGLRRVARSELRQAARTLRGTGREATRVHNARKHLKKLRALLRLVRAQTGPGFFRIHNRRLRDLGRRLAPLRDAEVAQLTLGQMRRAAPTTSSRRAVSHLRARISARIPAVGRGAVLRQVARELQTLEKSVPSWPLGELAWPDLTAAVVKTYRRARIEHEHFRLRRDLASLHEWRKRSKDLWYQLLLLQPLARGAARKLTRQLDCLTDIQGRMHDVQLVLDALRRQARHLSVWEQQAVQELAEDSLATLMPQALTSGRRLFRFKPDRFADMLRRRP
jgi:CHAD domain-containing protein